MIRKFVESLLVSFKTREDPISREDAERIRFSQEVKTQLLKLKEKGLALPIFTL